MTEKITELLKSKYNGFQEMDVMKAVLKKQLDEMTEDELTYLLKRDYLRRLTRYKMTDGYYRDKYKMDFESFESANIIQREKYSFEVESDSQEWELAIDGIKTVERKLRELLPSLDSPNEHIFIDERKSIQDFVEESMKYLEEKEIL